MFPIPLLGELSGINTQGITAQATGGKGAGTGKEASLRRAGLRCEEVQPLLGEGKQ